MGHSFRIRQKEILCCVHNKFIIIKIELLYTILLQRGGWEIFFDLVDSDCILVHQYGRMLFELVCVFISCK